MSLMPADGGEGVGPPREGNQHQQQPPRPQQQRCYNKQKNREEEGENCEEEETCPLEAFGNAPASNTSTDVSGAQGLTACKEEGSGDMTATTTTRTAAVVKVVDTNAGSSQQNGIVAPARSGVTEYTCSGRSRSSSVGSSAHVSPSRFVVGSTRHISLTTKPPAPGNGVRASSVSLSSSQMQAVIKFVSCRASGDKKQNVTQASVPVGQSPLQTPGNDTSASTARASVDATPMPTLSLSLQGQSSKGQMASSSAIDLPLPHVSLRQCTSTPFVPNTVGTQPHSCYEKEEERDYFLQKVTPQLHRMLPLWRKNFGNEMVAEEGMKVTATTTTTEAKSESEAECQQEQRQEKILSENDIIDRRLRQRLPEVSSRLHIRLPASPMCNAANSAYNPGSSDFDVSVSSSSSSSRTLSTLQASSHHFVRSVCHVLTGTPTFSSCNVGPEENETEKKFGISKAQTTNTSTTTTTTTTKATTMTIDGGGGGGGSNSNSRSDGFVLTSHEQNDCICGVQARGMDAPVEFVQENSTRQVLTKNGNRSGVFTPSPLPPLPPLSHGACSSYSLDAAMVLPGLFLGSYSDALKIDALAAHGISLVINVAEECVMMETMIYNDYDIKFIKFPLKDHSDENITRYFGPITRIIHRQLHRRERALRSSRKAATGNIRIYDDDDEVMSISNKSVGGGVLVHCRMGVSRSAAIILAYLMIYGETLWVDDNCSIQNQHMEEESLTPIFTPPNVSPISTLLLDGSDVEKENHSTNGKCCECCCCCLAIQTPHITCNTDGVYTPSVVKSYRDAFEFLKKRKKDINPNIGFVLALRELDNREGK
ncbi:dual specificity protein phosphatase [Trypanosoma cruzi Dm28c]|uniref:protein-tyrosine-phosphatase n=2 Tax=Trypanosoma cruzi TaxID=5693 RepID=V5BJV8_TRYCR|nr:dual specificity protein phosphatase [Trypanosoma cruzi Dm28c]PBJ71254.1 dual specificity protein phosphatase [Trypanosoma cruzi cruzi]PWU84230.1 putative dual specificity protein phosphatase [Trypanosoma cruzi]PWU89783.1 putative dual specificity protein phosphatase [Trypanosoma cruzi]